MPWTDETVETLTKLWAEGLTTVEIAKIIGVTKNSVIGKVHRLGLPKRPSPIKTSNTIAKKNVAAPKKEKIKEDKKIVVAETQKIVKEEEKKIKVAEIIKPEPKPKKAETEVEIKKTTEPKIEVKEDENITITQNIKTAISKANIKPGQKVFKENISLIELESQSCRWPSGDPKNPEEFHFCGKKILIGETYCSEHTEKAYVKQIRK